MQNISDARIKMTMHAHSFKIEAKTPALKYEKVFFPKTKYSREVQHTKILIDAHYYGFFKHENEDELIAIFENANPKLKTIFENAIILFENNFQN